MIFFATKAWRAGSPAITRRNQYRSTSAMWRINPRSDIVEGGTERVAKLPGIEIHDFISIVSR